MKIILGDGRLGSILSDQTGWEIYSRNNKPFFDFNKLGKKLPEFFEDKDIDTIINCIAYTDTLDNKKDKHWQTNYLSVIKLIDLCNQYNKKLVHISSDYVYSNSKSEASEQDIPMHLPNWYSYTKLLSDAHVEAVCKNYLTVRTSFKVRPFTHNEAWIDLIGNFDYTDVIASLIIKLIDKNANGIYNVGTDLKTVYELAKMTNPDVRKSIKKPQDIRPIDVSMNLDKMNKFLKT